MSATIRAEVRLDLAAFKRIDEAFLYGRRRLAERIAQRAGDRVPVLTGRTRESIKVIEVDADPAVLVGGVGRFLELGTADMTARPFLVPAAIETLPDVQPVMRDAFEGLK